MFRMALIAVLAVTIHSGGCFAVPAASDEASISQLLHGMFDKPQEPLSVEPIMVSGDHAVADWAQGQMGGRALLRRHHGAWTIILCAGDGIKSKEALVKAGVPFTDAERLESDITNAEAEARSGKGCDVFAL